MTLISYIFLTGMSLFLAGRQQKWRAEITQLARVGYPAGKSTSQSKDQF